MDIGKVKKIDTREPTTVPSQVPGIKPEPRQVPLPKEQPATPERERERE